MYFIFYVSIAFFVGLIGVFSNPSPCFGTFFLVVSSGVGCGIVAEIGASFSALLLFLIYLGGMLVVFAYSVSFCWDLYPGVFLWRFTLLSVVFFVAIYLEVNDIFLGVELSVDICQFDPDYFGVPLLYSYGGYNLLIVGFCLLLTLIVVVELVRGISFVSQKMKMK